MIPLFAIVVFAPKTRSSPSTLILAGVAIAYLFNAFDTILLVPTDTETLATVYVWHTGTLGGIHWYNIPVTVVSILAGTIVIAYLSKQLNLLALGDASATSLGVDPDNLRIICLVAIAFIVAAVVGNAGIIGFVGLVSPHIARMLIGSNNRFVIPAASIISITLMLVADIVCRTLSEVDVIPVGSMLALIGAPIFLYLIARRNSRVW
jgi:iron complex transport system permease protein